MARSDLQETVHCTLLACYVLFGNDVVSGLRYRGCSFLSLFEGISGSSKRTTSKSLSVFVSLLKVEQTFNMSQFTYSKVGCEFHDLYLKFESQIVICKIVRSI